MTFLKIIMTLTSMTSFAFLFSPDKIISEIKCGDSKLQIELISETTHLAVGSQTFLQLGFKKTKKDAITIDRFGFQNPKGIIKIADITDIAADAKQTAPWDVLISSAVFKAEDRDLISKCIQDNSKSINQALQNTDFEDVQGFSSLRIKDGKAQLKSINFLDSVYSVEEAETFIASGPYNQKNRNEFLSADRTYFRIALDNAVWYYDEKITNKVGYIDSKTKSFHQDLEGRSDTLIKMVNFNSKRAKNNEGKTLLEVYKP